MSSGVAKPIPTSTIATHGKTWTRPGKIVTSGPFDLTAWTAKKSMGLTKSGTYFDHANVTLQTITLKLIAKTSAAFSQFKARTIDTGMPTTMVGPAEIGAAKKNPRYYQQAVATASYLWFNSRVPALKRAKIRRILTQAIDRRALTMALNNDGVPLGTIIPPGFPGYATIKSRGKSVVKPTARPKQAALRKQLKKAGWKPGTTINLWYTTEGGNDSLLAARAIKRYFGKVGVKVRLVGKPSATQLYAVATNPMPKKVNMILLGWIADYLDPENFHWLFSCDSAYNVTSVCNRRYDSKLSQAVTALTDAARYRLHAAVESMLLGPNGSFPVAPLYQGRERTMVQSWISGFAIGIDGTIDLSALGVLEH